MKLRVLLISHTCQSRRAGQPKAEVIGREPDIDLVVLTPQRWRMYGRWHLAESPPADASFKLLAETTRLPWLPGAQNFLHYYPSLPRILREFRPQVIDLWEEPWSLVSAHTCRLRDRLLPDTHIISETEQNIHKRLPPPFAQFRRYTAANAQHLIGRNRESLDVMAREGYDGPASVVPNAVDVDLFHPMDRATARTSARLDGFVLGYFGRLVEEKGLDDLIDALPDLPADCRVLLVGDGPAKPALIARAESRGVLSRVEFRPGVSPEELVPLMNALDVFVLPSRTTPGWKEQFGRVIIEAMACGVPVIGSDSGAIPDVIADTGLVFPERDPRSLADAIRRLHADPVLRATFAREGRRRAVDEFSWRVVGLQMAQLYRSLAASPATHQNRP